MFPKELKQLRHDLGLTQAEMAHRLDIDPSTYCRWEHKDKPPAYIVERISKRFNVDASHWIDHATKETAAPDPDTKPRIVHLASAHDVDQSTDDNWRSKAVDLLSRMADMLETLLRGSRGGGGYKLAA